MNPFFKKAAPWLLYGLGVLSINPTLDAIVDVAQYHRIADGKSVTPWFDNRWWVQPYTHYRLAQYPRSERWTNNGIGSERWLVREVQVGRITYWTDLRRIPIKDSESGHSAHSTLALETTAQLLK